MFAMKTTERTIYSDIDRTKEHLFIYFLTELITDILSNVIPKIKSSLLFQAT